MKLKCLLISFVVISLCAISHAKESIAVYKISTEGSSYKEVIVSDFIESELIKIRLFNVVSRNQMDMVLREQGFQQSGVCDKSDCLVQVGQLLGVDKIITGSLFERSGTTYLQLKSINVVDGKISGSALIKTESVLLDYPIFNDLERLLGVVSSSITTQILPKQSEEKDTIVQPSPKQEVATNEQTAIPEIRKEPNHLLRIILIFGCLIGFVVLSQIRS